VNIFLDFDGTLLDISAKYNSIYSSIREKFNLPSVDYWGMRRNGTNFKNTLNQLGLPDTSLENFRHDWELKVEEIEFLKKDSLFSGVKERLRFLSQENRLILCTARTNRDNLEIQLSMLGIAVVIDLVLLTGHKVGKGETLIEFYSANENLSASNDWIVGDSTEDIKAGRLVGIKTCGVLSGLGSESDLKYAGASVILSSFAHFSPGKYP